MDRLPYGYKIPGMGPLSSISPQHENFLRHYCAAIPTSQELIDYFALISAPGIRMCVYRMEDTEFTTDYKGKHQLTCSAVLTGYLGHMYKRETNVTLIDEEKTFVLSTSVQGNDLNQIYLRDVMLDRYDEHPQYNSDVGITFDVDPLTYFAVVTLRPECRAMPDALRTIRYNTIDYFNKMIEKLSGISIYHLDAYIESVGRVLNVYVPEFTRIEDDSVTVAYNNLLLYRYPRNSLTVVSTPREFDNEKSRVLWELEDYVINSRDDRPDTIKRIVEAIWNL